MLSELLITALLLFLRSLVPITFSVGLRAIDKYTKFKKIKKVYKQLIIGIIFGLISIYGSEFGVTSPTGAKINIRDAAPICAGIIFGGPAGIIAGLIGGIERYLAVLWEPALMKTRVACSVSTIMAGFFAAFIRKNIFDNHHGTWYYGFAVGVFVESFHMLMVFLTKMNNIGEAYSIVRACAVPMILANSLCVMFAVMGTSIISKEPLINTSKPIKIQSKIQIGLAVTILVGFIIVSSFSYNVQKSISTNSTNKTLTTAISDAKTTIVDEANNDFVDAMKTTKNECLKNMFDVMATDETLNTFCSNNSVSYISKISRSSSSISYSNDPFIKTFTLFNEFPYGTFDSDVDGDFKVLDYTYISSTNENIKYGFVKANNKGDYLLVGLNEAKYNEYLLESIKKGVAKRHIGEKGYIVITDEIGNVLSTLTDTFGENIDLNSIYNNGITIDKNVYSGTEYYIIDEKFNDFYIIASIPVDEADLSLNTSMYVSMFMEILAFFSIYCVIYISIKRSVIKPLKRVNKSLDKICYGDLEQRIDEYTSHELEILSEDINHTVDTLKHYMDKESKKIQDELNFAKEIQHSSLPSTFPPFPNYHEFDIYASMDTAKEVGGDFYDFYLTDDRHLCIIIADVSGKGVPAAMFMMQSKTIIKSLMESGLSVEKAFTVANEKLCEHNTAQMFVTSWIGLLDLDTGVLNYANAGHNPPLIKHGDNSFEYLKSRPGLVLAGMEGVNYRLQTTTLNKGDELYLYTDGVTEAQSINNELFTEERLLDSVNKASNIGAKEFCESILTDVKDFTKDAEQSDDITMLYLKYYGERNIKDFEYKALIENGAMITEGVEEFLSNNDIPMKVIMNINVAIDEIYSNICYYAYDKENVGNVKITTEIDDSFVILKFEDHGIKYNPLLKDDPDVTLSLEERQIGGLGIFMVKKMMDEINYEYINGRNVLTIKKKYK